MDRLDNPVRRYAWGSARDIPDFLGVPADGGPQAELWMGAHPGDSSRVTRAGVTEPLDQVIAADPAGEPGCRSC
jgi:mannose-6-phosphate isomerase